MEWKADSNTDESHVKVIYESETDINPPNLQHYRVGQGWDKYSVEKILCIEPMTESIQ